MKHLARLCLAVAWTLLLTHCLPPSSTETSSEDVTEDTLLFSGNWNITERSFTRSEIAAMEGFTTIQSEIVPRAGAAELGVIPLKSLIANLGFKDGANGLVLECTDRWESCLELSLIEEKNPYLLLYYNGEGSEKGNWPMFGGDIEALGPFYVFILDDPNDYVSSPKYGMVSATQISGIRAVNVEERYEPFYAPPMDKLSPLAQQGRALFLQRCNTCHMGPGNAGGNVSQRPFAILQTHATHNVDYFKQMVLNPKKVFPDTIMPNNPDFDEDKFEKMFAYLAESAEVSR